MQGDLVGDSALVQIPQRVRHNDSYSDSAVTQGQVVQYNLTVSDLSTTETEALTDFAYNIRKAPQRIASFRKESGSNFFLKFMGDATKYPRLGKRRVGESILFSERKYFGFEALNQRYVPQSSLAFSNEMETTSGIVSFKRTRRVINPSACFAMGLKNLTLLRHVDFSNKPLLCYVPKK